MADDTVSKLAFWRPRLELVGLLIVLGDLLWGLGNAIQNVFVDDTAVSGYDTFSAWDLGGTWTLIDVGIVGVGVLLAIGLRLIFSWPDSTPSGVLRATLLGALVVSVLVMICAAVYAAEPYVDDIYAWADGEKIGYTVTAIGAILGAVGLMLVTLRGFSLISRSDPERPTAMNKP